MKTIYAKAHLERHAASTWDRRRDKWGLRKQAAANLLRMGHCAPTVMQTLLDVTNMQKEWLVKLSAGMPGGIGNTGFECGAMTSPLLLLGLRHGLRDVDDGLPVIFDKGHAHCQQFLACHKTLLCREIRQKDRFPKHCIRPVCMSPELLQGTLVNHHPETVPVVARSAYCQLYSHMSAKHFHCARAVFDRLHNPDAHREELLEAVSAFVGGTLFMGLTCSVLTAGIMAIGLHTGEIENSPMKVARMLARMTFGGDAFDENINKFNRTMNAGYRMSKWFAKEYGSTQCRLITGCDFSAVEGVQQYIGGGCVTKCKQIVEKVAEAAQRTIADLEAGRTSVPIGRITSPPQT